MVNYAMYKIFDFAKDQIPWDFICYSTYENLDSGVLMLLMCIPDNKVSLVITSTISFTM